MTGVDWLMSVWLAFTSGAFGALSYRTWLHRTHRGRGAMRAQGDRNAKVVRFWLEESGLTYVVDWRDAAAMGELLQRAARWASGEALAVDAPGMPIAIAQEFIPEGALVALDLSTGRAVCAVRGTQKGLDVVATTTEDVVNNEI